MLIEKGKRRKRTTNASPKQENGRPGNIDGKEHVRVHRGGKAGKVVSLAGEARRRARDIPDVSTFPSMAQTIKAGLMPSSLYALQEMLGITKQELAARVNIPKATLDRRARLGQALLPDETERVLRLFRLFRIAEETLGNADKARLWFHTPSKALGGASPLEYADNEPGAREVENLLGRIQYGVYS